MFVDSGYACKLCKVTLPCACLLSPAPPHHVGTQWLQACIKLDLSEPQHKAAAQAALQSMLDNIPAAATAGSTAADGSTPELAAADAASSPPSPTGTAAAPTAAQTQAELIAAECCVRKGADALGLSFAQQSQLRDLVQQLLKLEPSSLQVQLFLAEYEVRELICTSCWGSL